MKTRSSDCWFCRFMRGLSFGALGAAAGGLSAQWLGADLQTVIISAFLGALGVVGWISRKR